MQLADLVNDGAWAAIYFVWVMLVVQVVSKAFFRALMNRGLKRNVAVYYTRKLIHILAGGVVAVLVPYTFREPFIPAIFAGILAVVTYLPHRTGKLMDWFQVSDNAYETNFCIAWGASLLVLWLITGNPFIAVVPPMMISFGDAVTGIVRNAIFGRRTKHWAGNAAMAAVTLPLGFIYAGLSGALAAAASTIIERFEFNPIDDNILIAVVSTLVLLLTFGMV